MYILTKRTIVTIALGPKYDPTDDFSSRSPAVTRGLQSSPIIGAAVCELLDWTGIGITHISFNLSDARAFALIQGLLCGLDGATE